MTPTPQNTSDDIQLCKSCYCMTHDSQDNPGHCGKCGAMRGTSNSGSESNSPEIDGIKTLRRVLLEFDQSRAKTCIGAVQGDIDRTEADAQLEQSLANAIAAINRLYAPRGSNSGSELELGQILLSVIAPYNNQMVEPIHGQMQVPEISIDTAIAAINRLYIKRSEVVEAVPLRTRCAKNHTELYDWCRSCDNVRHYNDTCEEILTRLGLSAEKEDT